MPEVTPEMQWSDMMLYMIASPSRCRPHIDKQVHCTYYRFDISWDSDNSLKAGWVNHLAFHRFSVSKDIANICGGGEGDLQN